VLRPPTAPNTSLARIASTTFKPQQIQLKNPNKTIDINRMIKCLTKAYAAHGKKIPKVLAPHSPRHGYHTEAVDYVHGIRRGRICGVAATVVNECPICTKILRENNGETNCQGKIALL